VDILALAATFTNEGFMLGFASNARRATIAVAALVALASTSALAKNVVVQLTGKNEVPPVASAATGQGTFVVNDDRTLSGSITTSGLNGSGAHLHVGAAGKNGPVAVPLAKSGDNGWSVPKDAKLTDEQYKAFQQGDLYVNVHSPAHPDGEIRAQLKP
jgi:hypothetical protein